MSKEKGLASSVRNYGSISGDNDEGQKSLLPGLDAMSHVGGRAGEKYDPSSPELQKAIDRALMQVEIKGLLDYEDLPPPWQITEFILHGYRFTKSHWATAGSAFCLHNETVNIWTHAIAAVIILLAFPLYISPLPTWYGPGGYSDVAMAATYFLCFGGCMVCSIMWHSAKCSSSPTAIVTFVAVDVLSISLACSSFNFASVYCAFYQETAWLRFYLTIAGAWCVIGMVLPFTSIFECPNKAVFNVNCDWLPVSRTWMRTLYFCSMLATGTLIPMAHSTFLHGWDASVELYSHCVPVLAPPFVGAMIYTTQFPESEFPRRFDYVGSNHNLWHVFLHGVESMVAYILDTCWRLHGHGFSSQQHRPRVDGRAEWKHWYLFA